MLRVASCVGPNFVNFLHNFNIFISISLLKLKLSHKDKDLTYVYTILYGIIPLHIKIFDQLKASTSPKITLLHTTNITLLHTTNITLHTSHY